MTINLPEMTDAEWHSYCRAEAKRVDREAAERRAKRAQDDADAYRRLKPNGSPSIQAALDLKAKRLAL